MRNLLPIILSGLLLLSSNQVLATLEATVDRTAITEADQLELKLRLTNATDAEDPNLSVLARDFDILGSSRSSRQNFAIINGRQTAEVYLEWTISLRPKRLGQLQIPVLEINGVQSEPITINVRPLSAADQRRMNQFVFFDTSVDTTSTYVQGQVIYTIKLHYADGVSGDFPPEPRLDNAVITTLEEGKRYQSVISGRRFYVLEKRYAIFPQSSGQLEIPREAFTGARGRGGLFAARERVNAISTGHSIEVRARPPGFAGRNWLPAESLTLAERWTDDPPQFQVGEPINRTIELVVEGLPASQLPPLADFAPELQQLSGAKVYVDPPKVEETPLEEGLLSRRIETMGIVPTAAGSLTLPEIRIPWWNTVNDTQEVAIIPAVTYNVLPAANTSAVRPIQTAAEPLPETGRTEIIYQETGGFWRPLAVGAMLLALFTLGLWLFTWRRLQQLTAPGSQPKLAETNSGKLFKTLAAACQAGDANQAHRALFDWAVAQFPGVRSLQELEQRVARNDFSSALRDLEQHLFAPGQQQTWQGQALLEAATGLQSHRETTADSASLQPLNPL